MRTRLGLRTRWVVLALAVCGIASTAALGQNFLAQVPGPALPDLPPQGAWGEVIFANAKWLVVQNHMKQQFPIQIDDTHLRQFLVRWPSSLDLLTEQSLVEAIGQDAGSNTLVTDHADVYEGSDQFLVRPVAQSVLPDRRSVTAIDPSFNRFMMGWDMGSQAMLYGWAYPVPPMNLNIPARLHVVGNVVNKLPLTVGTPGNNFATIAPGSTNNIVLTQVTLGSASFIQKGDTVFLLPLAVTPKSLVLQQLVLYKKMPRHRFQP